MTCLKWSTYLAVQAFLELPAIVQAGERIAHRLQIEVELPHHLPRKNAQRPDLLRIELSRNEVDHAQRSQHVILRGDERHPGVGPRAGRVHHQRVLREPRIFERVGNHEDVALANRMTAEEVRVRHLPGIDSVRRLEEQAVAVDQAHQGNRRLADIRRQAGEIVEPGFAPGIEHAIGTQGRESRALLRCGKGNLTPLARVV